MSYDFNKMKGRKPAHADDWAGIAAEAIQLFTPSAHITMLEFFNGRTAQIREVTDAIFQIGRHAMLYGEKGVGKSSLAEIIHLALPEVAQEVMSFYVQANHEDDFKSIWKSVFDEICLRHPRIQTDPLPAVDAARLSGRCGTSLRDDRGMKGDYGQI